MIMIRTKKQQPRSRFCFVFFFALRGRGGAGAYLDRIGCSVLIGCFPVETQIFQRTQHLKKNNNKTERKATESNGTDVDLKAKLLTGGRGGVRAGLSTFLLN